MTPSRISAAPWAGRSPRLPVSLALALAVVQAASLLTSPAAAAAAAAALLPPPAGPNARPIFDGKTLAGWEGNPRLWRVEGRAITGGSLTETVRENDFIASTRDYTNFIVRLKIRLTGTNGFINSGFQMRSQRVPGSSEMAGYQCDFGEPSWYGCIYDESRRNRLLASSDMAILRPVLRTNDWNDYVIRADGARITTWINGVLGVDYTERETGLPNFDWGKLGLQVHGGGKALAQMKDVFLEELPPTPPGKIFRGAPEPRKSAGKIEAVSPEEEQARFTVAPGFQVELVVSEDIAAGFGKFVAVDWDQHGNLWTMTALEYPVDANESPAVAKELYASRARDKVLVYARDPKSPTGYVRTPRVFAEGLAIPLGILPYKNGVYVQHGTEIVFLSDTDGDGRADKRQVILSGFGVQDSHLFPHQFTRAPGNWIWFAQGAFNYGKVKTSKGAEVQFDQTRMARFRPDGSAFDITSQGPCNIWGLHMTMLGETWIQEANDFGYPAMPFHEYANYPGCSQAQWKSYAPEFPGPAPHFAMGGTGLSGLAISDHTGWPEAYRDVLYIANPITRKIQALLPRRQDHREAIDKLPDFIQSSDEMFRPVALRLGPDGALYFVDWYNKVISHNEVPRNHPERDKKHGRIWRVRPSGQPLLEVPDFTTLPGPQLLARLGVGNTLQSHLAWQAIGDRQMRELIPGLSTLVRDARSSPSRRIAALWSLLGLQAAEPALLKGLLTDPDRHVRCEAVRALGGWPGLAEAQLRWLEPLLADAEPEVRTEVIRLAGRAIGARPGLAQAAAALCVRFARAPLDGPTMRSTQGGRPIKSGVAYDREFERYLVRLFLEQQPETVRAVLASAASRDWPVENRLVAALALAPKESAARVAEILPSLGRPPWQEELLRLAQFPEEPGVGLALQAVLEAPSMGPGALEALLNVRTRLDASRITPLLASAAGRLLDSPEPRRLELGARLAGSFQLASLDARLATQLQAALGSGGTPPAGGRLTLPPSGLAALQALRDLKSEHTELFSRLAEQGSPAVQEAAVGALGSSRDPAGPLQLARLYPTLASTARRAALTTLTGTKPGAQALVRALLSGAIARDELDGAALDRLQAVLGEDPELGALLQELASFFRPALRLDGSDNAWVESDITLSGPFTVETWVKLDPGIDNNDSILGAQDVLDLNFFGSQFRVWVGGGFADAIVARKRMIPEVWTHLAVTRDEEGRLRLYQNGELDTDQGRPVKRVFEHLSIAWSGPPKGTAGWLSEFRIWNTPRSADEIRADFDRSFEGDPLPPGLVTYYPGGGPWGHLQPGAKVRKTADYPPLLTPAEAKVLAEKFGKYRALAAQGGDVARGKAVFQAVCLGCHSVAGQGGQVGPVLNGAGASGVETLLRNVLTPNAAMEAGYRAFRVETRDGEVLDGIRVSEDREAIVLRRPNVEDLRVPQADVRKAGFTRTSMMPEGLLDPLPAAQVSDLFAYIKTLK